MKQITETQKTGAVSISAALFSAAVTIVALAAIVDQFTVGLVV